jgi:hypothetical protein
MLSKTFREISIKSKFIKELVPEPYTAEFTHSLRACLLVKDLSGFR